MRTLNSPEGYRNMGFWNEATQQGLYDMRVGLGGASGTASNVGIALARMGVQEFVIADPEGLERTNGNRVSCVREETLGRNKAEVLGEDILAINPDAKITVYKEGVSEDNKDEIARSVDVILNGIELTTPQFGAMICDAARARRVNGEHAPIPVVDVEYVGHAGQVFSYHPRGRKTFRGMMGLPEGMPYDEVAEQVIDPKRYLAYIPPYGDIHTLEAIRDGASLPSNNIGAGVAAQLGAAEMVRHARVMRGERGLPPTYAPRVRWSDAYTGKSGWTDHPTFSYHKHLLVAVANNLLHRNEPASYTPEERAARGDY